MDIKRIQLIVCWVCLVLIYLLGDVLRVYEKGREAAVIDGKPMNSVMFLLAALIVFVPILMALLTAFLPQPAARWGSVAVSALLFALNASGVAGYASLYDRLLIVLGLLLNAGIVWLAFSWQRQVP